MSCLFESLCSNIQDLKADQLRQMIVQYLQKNPILVPSEDKNSPGLRLDAVLHTEFGSNMTVEAYTAHMSHPDTWGGAIEIRAFCDMFNARVKVVVLSSKQTIEFLPIHNPTTNEFIISWNGGHFEPISP